MAGLLSQLLTPEELKQVRLHSYFYVLEKNSELHLLPSDHGMYYPLVFNKDKKVIKGTLNFFNKVLLDNYKPDNKLPVSTVINPDFIRKKKKKAIVVNLVDKCFGHTFHKMLNLQIVLQKYGDEYDIYAVSHKLLAHFMKDEPVNVIVLKMGFKQAEQAQLMDEAILDPLRNAYDVVDFFRTDIYMVHENQQSLINLFQLFGNHTPDTTNPCLVFFYRSDFFRMWAAFGQAKRVKELFRLLKPFFKPNFRFVVIGEKDKANLGPDVQDERCVGFSNEQDYVNNKFLRESMCTIGVHGSHMVIPSVLSEMTIHLTPPQKVKHIGQDVINVKAQSALAVSEFAWLPSNKLLLSDLSAEFIAFQVINLIISAFETKYKVAMQDMDLSVTPISQDEFFATKYPGFNYNYAREFREKQVQAFEKPAWIQFHIQRLLKRWMY